MVITVCIAVLAFCTLVALATAVIVQFTGRYTSRDNSSYWFLVTIVGMIMLTITIGILCNTTNWK